MPVSTRIPNGLPYRRLPVASPRVACWLFVLLMLWVGCAGAQDTDTDGLSDQLESIIGSDPAVADTDGDLQDDFAEFYRCRSPLLASDSGAHRCRLLADPALSQVDWVWSQSGPVPGMHCVAVRGALDPGLWPQTHFCTRAFVGMRWSSNGAIPGMSCIAWHESADPDWNNQRHFLCFPLQGPWMNIVSDLVFFTSGSPPSGLGCLAIRNDLKPPGSGWDNNFLCVGFGFEVPENATCLNCNSADLFNGPLLRFDLRDPFDGVRPASSGSLDGMPCASNNIPGQCRIQPPGFANLGAKHLLASARAQIAFDFPPPVLSSVSPGTLPAAGATLTLQGDYFGVGQPVVRIGGQFCNVTSLSVGQLQCAAPPQSPGSVPVRVRVGNQESGTRMVTYLPPPPQAQSASVMGTAPTRGGGALRIVGQFLDQSPSVFVGGQLCQIDEVVDTLIRCTMPPGRGRMVPVSVLFGQGTTASFTVNYDAPAINSVTPPRAGTAGQVYLTLSGDNFGDQTDQVEIRLGGTMGPRCRLDVPLASVDHDSVRCLLEAGQGADLNLLITVSGQQSNAFLYSYAAPVIDSVSTRVGPVAGGYPLTIIGSQFGTDPEVRIGTELCQRSDLVPHQRIVCDIPAGLAGTTLLRLSVGNQDAPVIPFTYSEQPVRLALEKSGSGAGGVSSQPAGLQCGPACSASETLHLPGELVRLTALPDASSAFIRWSGACSSSVPDGCALLLNADAQVDLRFEPGLFQSGFED